MKASAFSEPGKRTNTNSAALQRYTYTGTSPTTRTFGGTLTYQQEVTGSYPFGFSGVLALIDVFTLPVLEIEVGDTPESNFSTLFNLWALDGYMSLGFDSYMDSASTTSGLATLGVTVTLNPGDTVWVHVRLQTPAVNGGFVDAAQTLITGWDNPRDLVPAATVPEPATMALVAFAMIGLGMARRRLRAC